MPSIDIDKSVQILSDITVYMKYARYLPERKRRETWSEIVDRNKAMHKQKFPDIAGDIDKAYEYVYDKKVLPSMRSMQFAGKPIEVNPARIFNCSYLPIDHPDSFAETMYLLLSGVGVGYSVQKQHVRQLPPIMGVTHPQGRQRKKRYLIGDSIIGWSDAVKVLVESYFYGKREIDFDFRDIRPKGAELVTSGGKAPGPEPLRESLVKIQGIFENAIQERGKGTQLKPIEVHDIQCIIADAVLAGGIRRAAMISFFSFDDYEMRTAKVGNWWEYAPQRGRANNSAAIVRSKITKEEFDHYWKTVEESKSGEPGFFFSNDSDGHWGGNPCMEISLRPYQFCVAGDTKLITKDGIEDIQNVIGKEVKVWNGDKWSKVEPYQTGHADRLHRVYFSDGSYLDATDNHKFLVKTRFEKEFREVETLDIIEELKNSKYGLQVPRADISYENTGQENVLAYDYGFILGDGNTVKKSKSVYASLYNDDKLLEFQSATPSGNERVNAYGTKYKSVKFDVDFDFADNLKHHDGLPKEVFEWNRESILEFIAGWADADGSQASNGIRIYGREDKLRDAQLLLTKVGIDSSLNKASNKGDWTNLGERRNDLWYLQITKTIDIPCQRLVCNNETGASFKGKHQIIKSVETLEGRHPSYCLTEDENHQCVFNNVLTKQCNLTEINASNVESQEDFNNRAWAAALIGTLQASYTDFHYLRDIWQETTEREALLGVSMTGIASGNVLKLNLKEAADTVKSTNATYADAIGINRAARTTAIKPAGTTSLALGTSSGVHGWWDPYYIRTIRVGKNEAIYEYLSWVHPELIEDEIFRPETIAVISVPQKAPKGAIYRHESPIDTLERVKKFNQEWVWQGHREGLNYNNVSCTINVKDNEWDKVGKWLWNNRDYYTGISVLPYDNHSYKQSPFQTTDKKTYEKMYQQLQEIDITNIQEDNDQTDLSGELACAGDNCEVTGTQSVEKNHKIA